MGPEAFRESIQPIPGIKIEVNEDCIGCGSCIEVCNFNAIVLHSSAAIITSRCKVCGRCVDTCPQNAIRMEIVTDQMDIEQLRQTIQSRTTIN
jgi:electron transfer flavoprotein alpha subunit